MIFHLQLSALPLGEGGGLAELDGFTLELSALSLDRCVGRLSTAHADGVGGQQVQGGGVHDSVHSLIINYNLC